MLPASTSTPSSSPSLPVPVPSCARPCAGCFNVPCPVCWPRDGGFTPDEQWGCRDVSRPAPPGGETEAPAQATGSLPSPPVCCLACGLGLVTPAPPSPATGAGIEAAAGRRDSPKSWPTAAWGCRPPEGPGAARRAHIILLHTLHGRPWAWSPRVGGHPALPRVAGVAEPHVAERRWSEVGAGGGLRCLPHGHTQTRTRGPQLLAGLQEGLWFRLPLGGDGGSIPVRCTDLSSLPAPLGGKELLSAPLGQAGPPPSLDPWPRGLVWGKLH